MEGGGWMLEAGAPASSLQSFFLGHLPLSCLQDCCRGRQPTSSVLLLSEGCWRPEVGPRSDSEVGGFFLEVEAFSLEVGRGLWTFFFLY